MRDFLLLASIPFVRFKNGFKEPKRIRLARNIFLFAVGLVILSLVFGLFRLVFAYFYRQPMIGPLLVNRMFSMAFLTFLFMLAYSNIMSSLSCHFLSGDLPTLMSTPARPWAIFAAKSLEALAGSSWMVVLMCIPLFAAFAAVRTPPVAFYPLVCAALAAFLLVPGAVSMGLNTGLMYFFPARRMREIMLLIGTVMFSLMVVMFRVMEPEKLVNPEESMKAVEFLRQLSVPDAPYLPSAWMASASLAAANPESGWPAYLLNSAKLWGAALLAWAACLAMAARFYRGAWQHATESLGVKSGVRFAGRLLPIRSGTYSAILLKDLKVFVRQPSQWGQVLLLATLVLIYLMNLSKLPPDLTRGLRSLLFFLNMGFLGLILTAVAARFLFPQVSLEGQAFAFLKMAPVSMARYLVARWMAGAFPLLALGLLLVAFSVPLLGVDSYMAGVAYISISGMTLAISALAVGCGAVFAKFRVSNPEEVVTSIGGFFFMMISLAYVIAVLIIEAKPVRMHYSAVFFGRNLPPPWLTPLAMTAVAALTALSAYLPLRLGARALEEMEL